MSGASASIAAAPSVSTSSNAGNAHADSHDDGVDYGDGDGQDMNDEDPDLEAMKARVRVMEQEAAKLREMHAAAERAANGSSAAGDGSMDTSTSTPGTPGGSTGGPPILTDEEKQEIDSRSIHVGNVDYSATPEEIQQHFASCGTINRVTILVDKHTGHPKGFAYVEFADPSLVANSMTMNESLFKGRLIKVQPKRTNVPHFMLPGRGRGGRGAYRGGAPRGRGYSPYGGRPPRGYRGGGRGRGRGA